jgi:GNAT superfamily N-acetyltransferase
MLFSESMRFQLIDDSDDRGLRLLYDLHDATMRADDPDGPPFTYDYFRGMVTYGLTGDPQEIWLAEDATAGAWFELPLRDNTHAVTAQLFVHPEHRRNGIGRELLAHVAGRVRAHGRHVLITDAPNSSPGAAFARDAGAEPAVEALRQVLDLADVPSGLPREAAGYELVRWEGPCPPGLRAGMARLRATMNDAPTGDLDWEDEAWDAGRVEATDRVYELRRTRAYTLAARHVASAEPAGYTEVHVDGDGPWAMQEDTAVARPHRGHRLGLVLKSVMLDWLREHEPSIRRIATWNAASNTHMRAVNERLGFREMDRWHEWQLRL